MIREAVHTAEVIVWGAIASVALLTVSIAGLAITAGAAAGDAIAHRHHTRQAIRRLEHHANRTSADAAEHHRKETES
ncbi:hypothetical protein KEF29_03525 [Streptomyces tuirus]|uniref:Uncharacterized protein n=1 Tax=Streptomyces tuirus TaxID=68278 RepID=A0A941FER5_9ACTN|nr:hypothetical protein [Streptomyces tuirus]